MRRRDHSSPPPAASELSPDGGDEGSLAWLAKQGDSRAVGALYDRLYPRVFRYALARLGHWNDAEDVAEETFLKAVRAINRYEPRPGVPFSAWLFRIAQNELVSHLRKRRGHGRVGSLNDAEGLAGADPAVEVERKLLLEQAFQAMAGLTEAQRQVMALRFGAGLSVAETAYVLGKREGNVRVLQHQALGRLKAILAEGQE